MGYRIWCYGFFKVLGIWGLGLELCRIGVVGTFDSGPEPATAHPMLCKAIAPSSRSLETVNTKPYAASIATTSEETVKYLYPEPWR